MLIGFTLFAKNLIRTRTGRAWQAIRDRDIAAEVMGVAEFRYKVRPLPSAPSSPAWRCAVRWPLRPDPGDRDFGLFFSVEFIAILLIGGAGTTSGPSSVPSSL